MKGTKKSAAKTDKKKDKKNNSANAQRREQRTKKQPNIIITIGGTPGSGKSTVGRMLAESLGIPFFSMGDIRRQYAREHGLTLAALNDLSEHDPKTDHLVDEHQQSLTKQHQSFIIDSRLGYHFLPGSVKVYIKTDIDKAAARIFAQHRASEHWKTVDEGIAALRAREASDRTRYKKYYRVDPSDVTQYDIVIDSTSETPETTLRELIKLLKTKKQV